MKENLKNLLDLTDPEVRLIRYVDSDSEFEVYIFRVPHPKFEIALVPSKIESLTESMKAVCVYLWKKIEDDPTWFQGNRGAYFSYIDGYYFDHRLTAPEEWWVPKGTVREFACISLSIFSILGFDVEEPREREGISAHEIALATENTLC